MFFSSPSSVTHGSSYGTVFSVFIISYAFYAAAVKNENVQMESPIFGYNYEISVRKIENDCRLILQKAIDAIHVLILLP